MEEDDRWSLGGSNTRSAGPVVGTSLGREDKDKANLKCGDITARILSALVEDKLLPSGYVLRLLFLLCQILF